MKKILSLLIACMLALPSFALAEGVAVNEWTDQIVMTTEDYNSAVGHTYATAYYGLWRKDLAVGEDGETRELAFYVPESWVSAGDCVFVVAPDGYTAAEFATTCGWLPLADEYGFTMVFLSGKDGQWDLEDLDAELPYLCAMGEDVGSRQYLNLNDAGMYLIGYGEGSTVANYAAMNLANYFTSVVLMGTPDTSMLDLEEISERDAFWNALMGDLHTQDAGYPIKNAMIPVWIMNDGTPNAEVEGYWKAINDTLDQGMQNEYAKVYNQDPLYPGRVSPYTALSTVWAGEMADAARHFDTGFNRYVWENFMSPYIKTRYQEYGRLAYNSISQMEKLEWYEEDVNGLRRMWAVYVPESYDPDVATPMVLFTHGHAHGIKAFFNATDLWRLAENYNFIILYGLAGPCTQHPLSDCHRWYTNDTDEGLQAELDYINMILDSAIGNYNIDTGRIYNFGHSNGGAMAWTLAEYMPERFAAFVPIGSANSRYTSIDMLPESDDDGIKYGLLSMWGGREAGADISEGSAMEAGLKRAMLDNGMDIDTQGYQHNTGLFQVTAFTNAQGIQMVGHVVESNMLHVIVPELMEIAWDYCCGFSRGADGELYYDGVLVG